MPKIIENLPERLAEEACNQVFTSGYASLTIRSVAAACGVGVGTVYNYYPSKESLVAAFMLKNWITHIHRILAVSESCGDAKDVLLCCYQELKEYLNRFSPVFQDESAVAAFPRSVSQYHAVLRSQLAEPIRKFCDSDFKADFIAESMLTWTVSGKEFSEIYDIIKKII